jgi:spermidine dehydrogenase
MSRGKGAARHPGKGITRRDFLNAVLLGTGAALLDLPAPLELLARSVSGSGYGGVGDYASSAGNTEEVVRIFRKIAEGRYDASPGNMSETGETYDLAVVGGGLSGLGAAYEFTKEAHKGARCIILENHPIFGGAAKRNEFLVEGERLIAPQGSNSFGVIDRPGAQGYDIYRALGIPTEFAYREFPSELTPLEFDPTNFGYRLWFTSKSIGHYFDDGDGGPGRWVGGIWENKFKETPYGKKVRRDFLRWRNTKRSPYKGERYGQWLDSMTYQHYLEDVLGLDPAVTRYAHPVLASVVGLGCDAISAYAARQVSMPGFPEFRGNRSLKRSHWRSFPGGNDGFSRYFVKALIPGAIEGGESFGDIHNGRVNFSALDREGGRVRLRTGASVVRVEHESTGKGVSVVYERGGRLHRLRARAVVMASGSRTTRRVVRDLPPAHAAAYGGLHVSPILVVNVALTNWRFLYRLGFTACKWSSGFGFGCNIRKPMLVGDYRPPLHPDKPTVLTFYVSFQRPGLPIEEQGTRGRKELLGTSYAEYESKIIGQMGRLFSESGFDAERDVAGIILNRWLYAYANPQPGFYFGGEGRPAPPDVIRRSFGSIAFAHAELNGHQHWVAAVEEGRRAARQAMERR